MQQAITHDQTLHMKKGKSTFFKLRMCTSKFQPSTTKLQNGVTNTLQLLKLDKFDPLTDLILFDL